MKKIFSLLVITLFVTSLIAIGTGTYLYGVDKTKKCANHTDKKSDAKSCCATKAKYECPKEGCKHTADKPGKCPKCSVELKKHECKGTYTCSKDGCEHTSDKPGKCPKCGVELTKKACCSASATKTTTCSKHKKESKKKDKKK